MFKLFLLVLLAGVAYAGYASSHGWGYSSGSGGNNNNYNQGWSRPGWANVKLYQNEKSYKFDLNEHGKDYEKYVHQGAEIHHEQPVHYGGWSG